MLNSVTVLQIKQYFRGIILVLSTLSELQWVSQLFSFSIFSKLLSIYLILQFLILSILQAFQSSYLPVLSFLHDVPDVLTTVSEHPFYIKIGRFIENVQNLKYLRNFYMKNLLV